MLSISGLISGSGAIIELMSSSKCTDRLADGENLI